jgi:dTDP-4-amino-4,6-dideoxygalactose transaminase
MDNLQAALLRVKLRDLPEWIKRRRALAELYHQGLYGIPEITLPHFDDPRFYDVYQNYVIRAKNRDKLVTCLNKQGVETMISWNVPMYRQPVMEPNTITLPETEKICQEVVSLPMYPELTDDEVRFVADVIRQFYAQ